MRISDWSSDVCYSDLPDHRPTLTNPHSAPFGFYGVTRRANLRAALRHEVFNVGHDGRPPDICLLDLCYPGLNRLGYRSEERRVGKECVETCRSRWAPVYTKKKETQSHIQAAAKN